MHAHINRLHQTAREIDELSNIVDAALAALDPAAPYFIPELHNCMIENVFGTDLKRIFTKDSAEIYNDKLTQDALRFLGAFWKALDCDIALYGYYQARLKQTPKNMHNEEDARECMKRFNQAALMLNDLENNKLADSPVTKRLNTALPLFQENAAKLAEHDSNQGTQDGENALKAATALTYLQAAKTIIESAYTSTAYVALCLKTQGRNIDKKSCGAIIGTLNQDILLFNAFMSTAYLLDPETTPEQKQNLREQRPQTERAYTH